MRSSTRHRGDWIGRGALLLLCFVLVLGCRRRVFGPTCGDGMINTAGGETCDDANLASGDGCTSLCQVEPGYQCMGQPSVCTMVSALCGDGVVDPGETCDDMGESVLCDTDCSAAECGDFTINTTAGEQCDDGNTVDGDGCSSACLTQAVGCGNGMIDPGEDCDDGGETATCDSDCSFASCGDGAFNAAAGEQCDAAGASATCDPDCTLAMCGDGTFNAAAGEECDASGQSAGCDADCTLVVCGDATPNSLAGEECDTGGESASCDVDCTFVTCGDATPNTTAGEECDDGGESAFCDPDCTLVVCGDGTLNMTAGEQCDDGNMTSGDGCDFFCMSEGCGLASTLMTTFAGGNSHNGNMFDITALSTVTIESFDGNVPVGTHDTEIYYRAGGYSGFETSSAAWTFVGGAMVTSTGTGSGTAIPIMVNVTIPAGMTYGFYVTITGGANLDYTDGTSAGSVYSSDANIQLREGIGVPYPFMSGFSPRIWNGTIHYCM